MAEQAPVEWQALEILASRGYQEAITYAFVDPALQDKLFQGVETPAISNPIASDMAVMRASLWPGLIKVAQENLRRQQDRVRVFEHGARFETGGVETDLLAGLAIGSSRPEQWGAKSTARGFLRRQTGSRHTIRAKRRVRRVWVRDRYIAVPAPWSQRPDHAMRQEHRLDRRAAPPIGAGIRFHICPGTVRSRVWAGSDGENAAIRGDLPVSPCAARSCCRGG